MRFGNIPRSVGVTHPLLTRAVLGDEGPRTVAGTSPPVRARKGPPADGRPLVIVESPAKAKTIAGFLGADFVVESSIGHIRDLPRSAADVPAEYKGQAWAKLGVDVDHGFAPLYVVSPEKKQQEMEWTTLKADLCQIEWRSNYWIVPMIL